jgi:hypothetical protein
MAKRPTISNSAIKTLLTLANTPNDPRAQTQLRESIRLAIDVAWYWQAETALSAPEAVPSLKRIAKAAAGLRDALHGIPPGAEEWMRAAMPIYDKDDLPLIAERFANNGILSVAKLADYRTMATFLAVVAQDACCAATEAPKPPRWLGRPPISRKHHTFFLFVNQLLDSVAESGGHLTFTKAAGGRGTLVSALKVLSEYVPPGVIPNMALISRLDKIIEWRRRRTEDHE